MFRGHHMRIVEVAKWGAEAEAPRGYESRYNRGATQMTRSKRAGGSRPMSSARCEIRGARYIDVANKPISSLFKTGRKINFFSEIGAACGQRSSPGELELRVVDAVQRALRSSKPFGCGDRRRTPCAGPGAEGKLDWQGPPV